MLSIALTCINGWEIVAYNIFTFLFMSASPEVYNLWSAVSIILLYTIGTHSSNGYTYHCDGPSSVKTSVAHIFQMNLMEEAQDDVKPAINSGR